MKLSHWRRLRFFEKMFLKKKKKEKRVFHHRIVAHNFKHLKRADYRLTLRNMRRQQSGDRKPRWNIGEQSGKAMTKTFENAEPNVEWLLSKQRRLQNYCKYLTKVGTLLLSLFPSNNPRIRFQIREGAWKLYIGSINWIERRIDHKIQPIFARYIMQNDAERRSCVIDITMTHRDSFSRFAII